MCFRSFAIAVLLAALMPLSAAAGDGLRIIDKTTRVVVQTADGDVTITRKMTSCALNKGWLQPMVPVAGVTPVGEIEVIEALNDPDTHVVDMREIDWYVKGTIPGAMHIPYTEVAGRLGELGCKKLAKGWDCTSAKNIIAFCNGAVCPQSPTAIKAMHREGFPMSKVMYYRGGMLSWQALGLTTIEGDL